MRYLLLVFGFLIAASAAWAQPYQVVASCDGINNSGGVGSGMNGYMDTTGHICVTGGSLGTIATKPAALTIVTLDIKTVTTGGTAVTAIAAGNRTAGGFIQNGPSQTVVLCINEVGGAATGVVSSGDTTCIVGGQGYVLTPSALAVSVISSDSAHVFSGFGLK